ncbi:MAG: GNAT family N-acetyltransferase [Acidimicrobiia bacterium]
MKVAHLTTVDLSLRYLVFPQMLAVLDAGGEAIGISSPGPWVEEIEAAGIRHIPLHSSTRGMALVDDLRAAVELWRVLRREKPDILHTHNPKPGLYGRIIGRLSGTPVVINTVHGLYASPDSPAGKRALVYSLEALAARFSDAELVQSSEDLALIKKWRIAPRSRVDLLGNGIDLSKFRPPVDENEREQIRASLGLDPDQIAVGAVGRLVAEKGFPELFEAVPQLPDNYVVFAIGPDDVDKADALSPVVIEQARASGVRFLGMRTDIDLIYRALDLFVLPSHREGFPRAAMEAAASGLPVVATDIRGCREVVEAEVNGILVPVRNPQKLAEAIERLGSDPELRRKMGAAGVDRSRRLFDETVVVARVLATYRDVAVRKGLGQLASAFDEQSAPTLRRALPHETRLIAQMHSDSIATGYLSTLGVGFIDLIYQSLIAWPHAVVLVAEVGSVPVGFVVGVKDTAEFYKHFLRRRGLSAGWAALPRLWRPSQARKAWETLRYNDEGAGVETPSAELLAMAVRPEFRGQGLGTDLGVALLKAMEAPVKVVVGSENLGAIRAYERMGFERFSTIEIHRGVTSAVLRWDPVR